MIVSSLFFGKFLKSLGIDEVLTDLFVDLNSRSVRYVKIGNTFGPPIKCKAVIDDRTLRGPPAQVDTALRLIVDFDQRAGHITHPDKITSPLSRLPL